MQEEQFTYCLPEDLNPNSIYQLSALSEFIMTEFIHKKLLVFLRLFHGI